MDRQERIGKTKYLVKWKGYTVEENTWEGLENLKNARGKIEKFEKESPEVEEFKRGEFPGRYMAKLLYGWDDKKFDEEYLKKLERN